MSQINSQTIKNYFLKNFRLQFWLSDSININYKEEHQAEHKGLSVLNTHGNFFSEQIPLDTQDLIFKEWNGRKIPFLFSNHNDENIIDRFHSGIIINYDILGSAFYFLSGWQEYTATRTRQMPLRFAYNKSVQYHLNEPHIPWVNYYFDIFKTAIELYADIKRVKRKHKRTLFALTHDVDLLFSGWKEESYCHFRKGEFKKGANILRSRFKSRKYDPWFNLNEIVDFTGTLGFQSSYFMMASQGKNHGVKHADYSLNNNIVRKSLNYIKKKGGEIALHAATSSCNNINQLTKELNSINSGTTGIRFHYLAYDVQSTPAVLQKSGVTYDTTLGFAETIGFRNAITHPFYLFDITKNSSTDVIEIPLIIMDRTLQHSKYLNLSPSKTFDTIQPLLEEVRKFSGAVSILWHNSFLSPCKFKPWSLFFKNLIKQLTQHSNVTRADEISRIYLMK